MKEQILFSIKTRINNLESQNKELRDFASDEVYQLIYENEIRISECKEIIKEIEGGK